MPSHYHTVLSIAGSDSIAGAGIQADIKTAMAIGVYAMTAITAVTAQNSLGVTASEAVSPEMLSLQLSAVAEDILPDAVKIGMIPNKEAATIIAHFLQNNPLKNIVYDPVINSTSGTPLSSPGILQEIKDRIFPKITLLTPNIPETEALTGKKIHNVQDAIDAGINLLRDFDSLNILIKGGHFRDTEILTDILITHNDYAPIITTYSHPKIHTRNTHGTGCTLSSAIASYLALGFTLIEAVERGIDYLQKAMAAGAKYVFGHSSGHGPLFHNHIHNNRKS